MKDFQKLLSWCEEDQEKTKSVQRVLKLMRGWDAAAAHARSAVPEDSRARMFSLGTDVALLYSCKHGKVDLNKVSGERPNNNILIVCGLTASTPLNMAFVHLRMSVHHSVDCVASWGSAVLKPV